MMTWWVVLIEAALALAFLWHRPGGVSRYRHVVLILFAWTTYAAAVNVAESYGWTLMILGIAQCENEANRTRFAYVVTCLWLLVYEYVPIYAFLKPVVEALI